MTSAAVLVDLIDGAFGGDSKIRRIGVAVSGGSDSMALLHLVQEWGKLPVVAATVDHGLRPEAAAEAAEVAGVAANLGVPHQVLRWTGWDGKGNLQAEARRNRYGLLADWAKEVGADTVCLGHTLDDQVETFLMRLSRAAGLEGLSGMRGRIRRDGMRFDRPLLSVRRKALQDYLRGKGVSWIDDPSNEDEGFERVRARKALAGLEDLGFDIESIDHSIINLSLANLELRDRACEIARKITREPSGDLVFDRAALRRLNPEMQHRLLSKAFMFVSSEDYPPRADALSGAEAAIFSGKNHTLHGCLMMVSGITIRLTRELKAVERMRGPTNLPWDGRWVLDGPHAPDLEICALGEAVKDCPGWRETGMPRASLMASPAVWRGDELIAAPVAGLENGWTASATGRGNFTEFLLSR